MSGKEPEEGREKIAKATTLRLGEELPGSSDDGDLLPEVKVPSKYRLMGMLGRGGFGVVYLARDVDLDRQVALKFLTDARPAEVTRFRREARFAARLDDPAIVKIFELGVFEGQFYISMQYVEGGHLETAELSRRELVLALRAVGVALAAAHEQGIVHRDIKPENILIDTQKRPFLTDFGIARDLRGRGAGTEGLVVGTPNLMPPEQARGDAAQIDARSDVYSLGATLYAILAGQRPFLKPNLVETLYAVLHEEPTSLRELDPEIPLSLSLIADRCMRKDPRDRYGSMADVIADLDGYLARESGDAQLPSPSGRSQTTRARLPDLRDEPTPLVLGLEAARTIARWDADRYRITRDLPRTYRGLERLVTRLDEVLQRRPDVAWARFHRGMALRRLERLEPALEDMERSIDRLGEMAGAHFELGLLYLHLAILEQEDPSRRLSYVDSEDHLAVTEAYLDESRVALEESRRLEGGDSPWQVAFGEALRLFAEKEDEACLGVCKMLLERDPDLDAVWRLKGDALARGGSDPLACYVRAVELRRSSYRNLLALGVAYRRAGDLGAARAALRQSLEVHAGFSPAMLLLAQLDLEEDGREELEETLTLVRKARAAVPREGIVPRCDVEEAWLDEALAALAPVVDADDGAGLIKAQALLEEARRSLSDGRDPRPDLDALLELTSDAAGAPDDAWAELLAAAWRERES